MSCLCVSLVFLWLFCELFVSEGIKIRFGELYSLICASYHFLQCLALLSFLCSLSKLFFVLYNFRCHVFFVAEEDELRVGESISLYCALYPFCVLYVLPSLFFVKLVVMLYLSLQFQMPLRPAVPSFLPSFLPTYHPFHR